MTDKVFVEIIAVIERAYNVTLDRETRRVWWGLLQDLTDESAMNATTDCCRTSPYPPKPADIYLRCQPSKDEKVARATAAWRDALRAVADPYRSFKFQDRIIPLVLEILGGRRVLGAKTEEDLHTFVRRDFERLYVAFDAGGQHHQTGYIPGIIESENGSRGFNAPIPVVEIGCDGQGDTLRLPSGHPQESISTTVSAFNAAPGTAVNSSPTSNPTSNAAAVAGALPSVSGGTLKAAKSGEPLT